jgi:hypothetical protein
MAGGNDDWGYGARPEDDGAHAAAGTEMAENTAPHEDADRINRVLVEKADVEAELQALEGQHGHLHDQVVYLTQMLESRPPQGQGVSDGAGGTAGALQSERDLLREERDFFQNQLVLKRGEVRQLAAHVSSLRHALHAPQTDHIDWTRRDQNTTMLLDEQSLQTTRTRALLYVVWRLNPDYHCCCYVSCYCCLWSGGWCCGYP